MSAEEFGRALAALRLAHQRAARRVVSTAAGAVYLHDEVPQSHANNLLVLDDFDATAEAVCVAAEQGLAGLGHRLVLVYDDDTGARLAPGLRERGYEPERDVVMAHRGGRPAGLTKARAGTWEEVRPAMAEDWSVTLSLPEHSPVVQQLTRRSEIVADALGARWYVAPPDRPPRVEAFADLRFDLVPGVAQVEDVVTLPRSRRRGHARAVVTRMVQDAYGDGADLVFLVADEEDWPRHFYRRLGFQAVGASGSSPVGCPDPVRARARGVGAWFRWTDGPSPRPVSRRGIVPAVTSRTSPLFLSGSPRWTLPLLSPARSVAAPCSRVPRSAPPLWLCPAS